MEEVDEFGIPIKKPNQKKQTVDEFGIPVKKKVSTKIGTSTSTSQNQKSVSGQVDGSLGLPKQKLSQNDLDNLNNLPKQKSIIPELPKNLKKVIDNPENYVGKVPKKETRGFGGEVLAKLAKGSSQLGADIASIPELVYDVFAIPQNAIADIFDTPSLRTDSKKFGETIGVKNQVKEFYKNEVSKLKQESDLVDKKYQFDVTDSFINGDYANGFRQLTNSFAESLPATTSIMVGGAYVQAPKLLLASTMMFGAGKNEELKDQNPEMNTNTRVANALASGLAEGAFETIGSGTIGASARALVEREGKQKAFSIMKDGLQNFYKESLKKNPLTASATGEGVEEWATQVTQNAIDVATGVKPSDYNIFTGGADAFIGGAFGGAVFGGGLKGLDKIVTPKDNDKVKANLKASFVLQEQLENPEISPIIKAEIEKKKNALVKENQDIINSSVDKANSLDEKVKAKLIESVGKISELKTKAEEIKADLNTPDSVKKILLEELKNEYKTAFETKNSILEGNTSVVDVLPIKEQDKIKRQALKELTSELNPDGKKDMTISDEEISKRAIQIYNNEIEQTKDAETKPQEVVEQKPETQPQAKEQEKVAEVVSESNNNQINKPNKNKGSQEVVVEIPNPSQISNETNDEEINQFINQNLENKKETTKGGIDFIEVEKDGLKYEISKNTDLKKVFSVNRILDGNNVIYDKYAKTQESNTPANGDFSVGNEPMGEMGIEQKPTTEVASKESVQSTNDVRPIEGETEVDYALKQIDKGVLTWNGDIMSPRIDLGMSWADIRKGEADLKRGKVDSVPAKRLIEALSNAKKEGGYRYKLGTGGANMRSSEFVSFEDMQRLENEYQLTDSELEEINTNQEQLAKEYDDYINSLDEETQNEILENYEAKIDNTAEIGENTQSGKSEENVSDEKTSRKQQRKKIAEATIDDFANALKDLLPKANTEGFKKQGLSQDDIIDFIAKNAKILANTGIEIDEAIRQVIAKLKDNFEDFDINADDVKAKLEPKKETIEPEPFERKEGQKSVLTRASQGNSASVKKAIAKYSLDYEIESQEVAKANAEKFVAEVGIEDAFTAVKSNQIPGAEGAFVYAEIIRQINENLESFTDEELIQYEESNMELLGEVTKMLDEKSRSAGRFISALGNIYQSSDGMYNLSIQVKNYKAQNGGTIPADILEKFTEANEKIKELEKQIAEAKKIREEQESVRSIEEIIESISRKNKIDRSKPISDKAKAKAFADKLRSFKTTSKGTLNASTPFSLAFDSAIEIIATSIEAGGKISDAIKQGVEYIRKQNLNKDEENQAIAQVFNAFEQSERAEKGIRLDDEGKLRIPHSILREKVEEGIDNVEDLVKAVKADVDEMFPDEEFTERQVRDAITQYGKTTNPTKDEIETEISIMKSLGKLLSGMEDAYDGKRPARSGLQRRPLTAEERTQMRKLKELLRDLPMDDADLQRTWKTALDAIKSRLTNEITDLDQQIANGEKRKGEKKAIEYDAEANALKAERDQKRQLLDELVGKPELTEEERINKAEILLEKSIIDLQEKIDAGDIAYKTKPTPLNSEKLKSLREQKKALLATMEQMRQDAGLAEMKRIQMAKNARIKRIAELKRRLDEKDFSKKERKPLPIDAELAKLEAEAMELKEIYDKEVYKLELKNQTNAQKFGKVLLEVLNIPKILSFTIDMSFVGIQGGIQFYRLVRTNPKKAMTIFANTVKAMFSAKTENRYHNELKSNPNYTLWRKAKLAITEVNYKTSAQEELFQHNIINGTLDALGDKLQEKGYTKLGAFVREYLNFTKIFERGQTYFLNQMRINRFDEGVDILRRQGKNELDDIKEYEKVASAVNTLTGRANTGQNKLLASARSLNGTLFSSFANWLSVINQLNPYWYATLTPTARKMAISDLFHFIAGASGFMALVMLASSEDDEQFTVETDPRSSDFMLLKKGNLRIDPWQTKKSHVVFLAKVFPYLGGVKKENGDIVEFGVDRDDKSRLELFWQYMSNKFSPGVSNLIQYGDKTELKEYSGIEFREDRFGNDYKAEKMFIPLYIQSLKEVAKEQPNTLGKTVSFLNYLGLINTQIYGEDTRGVKDRPDFDENGNKTVKSEKFSYPKTPSLPKPPSIGR